MTRSVIVTTAGGTARSTFHHVCGILGLIGCLGAVLGNIIGVIVHDQVGFVADTISDVAAGRHAWIQDAGLYAFAAGMLLVAVALYRWPLDSWRWQPGTVLLGILVVTILVIGAHGEYGDRDPGNFVIHIYLVYLLGVLLAAVALLTARGFSRLGRG